MSKFTEELQILNQSVKSFEKVREAAKKLHIPVMQRDTEQLLRVIAGIKQPENILEIGTAIGYSGCVMLLTCKKAKLNTVEIDEAAVKAAKVNFENCGVADRVTVFNGDAKEIVPKLTGRYDFIFLDGPKGQYLNFYNYLKDVLNPGGVLVCDNVLFMGVVENLPENKRHKQITIAKNLNAFLQQLCADKDFETTVLEVGDGVSISYKMD